MSLEERDRNVIWHPYTHLKFQSNIGVVKARGNYFYTEEGKKILDAISSWWVNVHGHGHPVIQKAISDQFEEIDHVLFAGVTHQPGVELAEILLNILPKGYSKVFYSDNGSTAVEVAIKMALQFFYNKNEKRKTIVAFKNSYHGDTFGAMAVSERSLFTKPFHSLLFDVAFIDVPVPGHEEVTINQVKDLIDKSGNDIAAFIFEPLVLGTAGMVMYESSILENIINEFRKAQAFIIADEVMTGFGRTGTMFAMNKVNEPADITCLSKGITGGVMAIGVTVCKEDVYQAFVSDDRTKTFFHGHSYTANPLACAASIASIKLFDNDCFERIKSIEQQHNVFISSLENEGVIANTRVCGTIMALEFKADTQYISEFRDKAYAFFIERDVLLRPLGNIIYCMPPYSFSAEELDKVYHVIREFIETVKHDL